MKAMSAPLEEPVRTTLAWPQPLSEQCVWKRKALQLEKALPPDFWPFTDTCATL